MVTTADDTRGDLSGLPPALLYSATACTLLAVAISAYGIILQWKNYRKPLLQREVVRIMLMVPVYALSSCISLYSLQAAFFIDAARDVYEAFVIYSFFSLLLTYLGGERSLLILLHGREPKPAPWPIRLWRREIDPSDPYLFLSLKRGILQYVQLKPILAITTMILKALGKYNEGNLAAGSGYLYISLVYNVSISISLYCLAMFWLCVNDDLKPFRPVPKFLCVKGILFFSFWQSFCISILVAAGAISSLGPYTDSESISIGLTDLFICIEMPLFAIAHIYAFSYKDFIDDHLAFVGRVPFGTAFRDSSGMKDVWEDTKRTLRGQGISYRDFEPSEGGLHIGAGRVNRINAGLRYVKGGKGKYWLPRRDSANVVHVADDPRTQEEEDPLIPEAQTEGYELPFGEIDENDEQLFQHAKLYLFGDYNYPCVDISTEAAKRRIWEEEEGVLRDERSAWYQPISKTKRAPGYGSTSNAPRIVLPPPPTRPILSPPVKSPLTPSPLAKSPSTSPPIPTPPIVSQDDAVDLVVEAPVADSSAAAGKKVPLKRVYHDGTPTHSAAPTPSHIEREDVRWAKGGSSSAKKDYKRNEEAEEEEEEEEEDNSGRVSPRLLKAEEDVIESVVVDPPENLKSARDESWTNPWAG